MTGTQAVLFATSAGRELHLAVTPDAALDDFGVQARSMYRRLETALAEQGMALRDVAVERVFLSDVAADGPTLGVARREAYRKAGVVGPMPACSLVQQPPAQVGLRCALQALALVGGGGDSLPARAVEGLPSGASGRVVEAGDARHLFLAGLTGGAAGDGLDFRTQARTMFGVATEALASERMSFKDVVRTWIHLADIDRDYAAFNRVRRDHFTALALHDPPASTGIGGRPFPPDRGCGLDLRAVAGKGARRASRLRPVTMNEAPSYGADFARGTRVEFADRAVLYISGTASIDETGQVVHAGDIEGQVDRALHNIEALLRSEGAGLEDIACATTYLKSPELETAFRRVAHRRGFGERTPNVVCVADICRAEWLVEIEVTAMVISPNSHNRSEA